MERVLISFAAAPAVLFGYAYVAYPAALWVIGRSRKVLERPAEPAEWPLVTVTVPVFNEVRQVRGLIESLLQLDYPRDRLHVLIVSDASDDGTDDIVREFAQQGVELLRMPVRRGKTASEQGAYTRLRGEIIINTDASIRLHASSIKPLVRALQDPSVGVASGRDISVGNHAAGGNEGEGGYVGYEMWIRELETRLGGIVGASGSLYAIRRELHQQPIPEALSRDFASALIARDLGYRAVSVNESTCVVPRTGSLAREFRRKARTMARGLDTLMYFRHLMNPLSHGSFAVKLISHKLARWLVYPFVPLSLIAIAALAEEFDAARAVLAVAAAGLGIALSGMLWPARWPLPRALAFAAFVLSSNVAGVVAWFRHIVREQGSAIWEPTRR